MGIRCQFGPNCRQFDEKWHGISMRIHVAFFTRTWNLITFFSFYERSILYFTIPCKKCDEDSHGNSISFHVANQRQFGPNWHQIPMTIPCHLSRFYFLSMLKHIIDFGQVQVMELLWHLLRKWWDSHRIWSHFGPNCREKYMIKSMSHFLQGFLYFLNSQHIGFDPWPKIYRFSRELN